VVQDPIPEGIYEGWPFSIHLELEASTDREACELAIDRSHEVADLLTLITGNEFLVSSGAGCRPLDPEAGPGSIHLKMPLRYRGDEAPESELSDVVAEAALLERSDLHANPQLQLATKWYADAVRSLLVDRFIKGWVALEILVPDSAENFRPRCSRYLASLFVTLQNSIIEESVSDLYRARNRILHEGSRVASDLQKSNSLLSIVRNALRLSHGLEIIGNPFLA
jgi:hypothetical protein